MEGGPSGGCAGPSGGLSAGGVDGLDSGEAFADRSSEGGGCQGFVEEEGRQEQTGGGAGPGVLDVGAVSPPPASINTFWAGIFPWSRRRAASAVQRPGERPTSSPRPRVTVLQ